MNNVRRFLGGAVQAVAPSEPPPPSPSIPTTPNEIPPWVEKATPWAPQRTARSNASISSTNSFSSNGAPERSRDSSSSSTIGPTREDTAPLFSTPGASTSSPTRSNGFSGANSNPPLRLARRGSPPPSPMRQVSLPTTPSPRRDPDVDGDDVPPLPGRSKSLGKQPASSGLSRDSIPSITSPKKVLPTPARSPRTAYAPRPGAGADRVNTRDHLLIMLAASQAVLDSRDFEVLNHEEIEELRTHHAHLAKRVAALQRKIILETKMRDAALKVAPKRSLVHKRPTSTKSSAAPSPSTSTTSFARPGTSSSSSPTDPLEQANEKIQETQRELLKTVEQIAQVEKRLLEHRAAVLSHAVRAAEQHQQQQFSALSDISSSSTSDSSETAGTSLSGELSPVSTAPTTLSVSSRSKFEGPHLYAGTEGAVIPGLPKAAVAVAAVSAASAKEVEALKAELATVQEALENARREIEELSALRQRREEEDARREAERANAQRRIAGLESEVIQDRQRIQGLENELLQDQERIQGLEDELVQDQQRIQGLEDELVHDQQKIQGLEDTLVRVQGDSSSWGEEIESLKSEKAALEMDHASLARLLRSRSGAVAALFGRDPTPISGSRGLTSSSVDTWDDDIVQLREALSHSAQMTEDRELATSSSQQISEELEAGHSALSDLAGSLNLETPSSSSLTSLVSALSTHIISLHGRADEHERAKNVWDAERARLEDVARMSMEAHSKMANDMEELRKERDDLRTQVREYQSSPAPPLPPPPIVLPPGDHSGELARVLNLLQTMWVTLPSAEARAKLSGKRAQRSPKSPSQSPSTLKGGSAAAGPSLSEMDVRSLKELYSASSMIGSSSSSVEGFSADAFVSRVQALLLDDKALVERLIRMASGHELLKSNADRARKLALDSSVGLETYQKQVKTLEERNAALVLKNAGLLDDSAQLQEAIEQTLEQKQSLEQQASEQASLLVSLESSRTELESKNKELEDSVARLSADVEGARGKVVSLTSALNAAEVKMREMKEGYSAANASAGVGANSLAAEKEKASKEEREKAMAQLEAQKGVWEKERVQLELVRNRMEDQLTTAQGDLRAAKDELDRISMAESAQRIALLDELNNLQIENGNLRNELRVLKK